MTSKNPDIKLTTKQDPKPGSKQQHKVSFQEAKSMFAQENQNPKAAPRKTNPESKPANQTNEIEQKPKATPRKVDLESNLNSRKMEQKSGPPKKSNQEPRQVSLEPKVDDKAIDQGLKPAPGKANQGPQSVAKQENEKVTSAQGKNCPKSKTVSKPKIASSGADQQPKVKPKPSKKEVEAVSGSTSQETKIAPGSTEKSQATTKEIKSELSPKKPKQEPKCQYFRISGKPDRTGNFAPLRVITSQFNLDDMYEIRVIDGEFSRPYGGLRRSVIRCNLVTQIFLEPSLEKEVTVYPPLAIFHSQR